MTGSIVLLLATRFLLSTALRSLLRLNGPVIGQVHQRPPKGAPERALSDQSTGAWSSGASYCVSSFCSAVVQPHRKAFSSRPARSDVLPRLLAIRLGTFQGRTHLGMNRAVAMLLQKSGCESGPAPPYSTSRWPHARQRPLC